MAARTELDPGRIRAMLEQERARLTEQLRALGSMDRAAGAEPDAEEPTETDPHSEEQGTDLFFREQDEAIADSIRCELEQVDLAERKLARGACGFCDRCTRPIPMERLEILPSAPYCVDCGSRLEAL
jgi:RNA polymerase-binding transcription factor DksA